MCELRAVLAQFMHAGLRGAERPHTGRLTNPHYLNRIRERQNELNKPESDTNGRPLKVDLHTHTADDPEETIHHTGRELIDKAHRLEFDALCITNHNAVCSNGYLRDYARELGIILLPGVEITVQGKHVIIINAQEEILKARTFDDLRRMRNGNSLIVAPHPYFPGLYSLFGKMRLNIELFDAIEFSWFYHSHINFNLFAARAAEEFGLPLLGTSDCHKLGKFGSTYSVVDAEKDPESIIEAVKAGRIEVAANPLKLTELSRHGLEHVVGVTWGMFKKLLTSNSR